MKPTILSYEELCPGKLPNNLILRIKQTLAFIKYRGAHPFADCGINNPMKQAIEQHFNIKVDSLYCDFDREPINNSTMYNTIFCFEVLEHLYNPLFFLENLKDVLSTTGIIYLSTPYQYFKCLKGAHHYHEIPTDRLMWLFKEAGLQVLNTDKVTIAGKWYNHISGIRPILRYFQKSRIYMLTREV